MGFYCEHVVLDDLEGRKLLSQLTAALYGHRAEMHLFHSLDTLFKKLPHSEFT